jgi:ribosomal protein S18 acetylase RimI-like enzyme
MVEVVIATFVWYAFFVEIREIKDQKELRAFKDIEWPLVDVVHFKNNSDLVDRNEIQVTYAAINDGKVAGYVKIETDMGVCKIVSIIVGHEYTKKGIGSSLMVKAEAKAKEEGCHKMILETGLDWDAKAFYEKLGYTTILIMKDHYAHGDFVIMEKNI